MTRLELAARTDWRKLREELQQGFLEVLKTMTDEEVRSIGWFAPPKNADEADELREPD